MGVGLEVVIEISIVQMHCHDILAEPQTISLEKTLRFRATNRCVALIDEHTVRGRVDDVVAARAKIDRGMSAGEIAVAVLERPIAFEGTADRASVDTEFFDSPLTEACALEANYFKAQRHEYILSGRRSRGLRAHPDSLPGVNTGAEYSPAWRCASGPLGCTVNGVSESLPRKRFCCLC